MFERRSLPFMLLMMAFSYGSILSCDQHPSTSIEGVLATVNGKAITQEDLRLAVQSVAVGHEKTTASTNMESTLENIILQELAFQRATKLGLDNDPKYQAELRGMEAQLNAFKRKKLSELLLQQELQKSINVSDAEALQYFNNNAVHFRTEMHVWQILRRDETSIKNIHAELGQGRPFEEVVAKLYPDNYPDLGRKPWDLGYLHWSQIPDAWRDVIYTMQNGETSDIIPGPNNRYWVIKLIDRRENTNLTFEQIKPGIIDILKDKKNQQLREETIRDLRDNANIVYSN